MMEFKWYHSFQNLVLGQNYPSYLKIWIFLFLALEQYFELRFRKVSFLDKLQALLCLSWYYLEIFEKLLVSTLRFLRIITVSKHP